MNAKRSITMLLAMCAAALGATATHAQLFRTYLSSTGSDANPCTVSAPCRLLPAALAAVTDGGEIWMLDSANYNTSTVSITKSVTIMAIPGVTGSVVATGGGAAIAMSAPAIQVALRNLVILPLGSGSSGVAVTAGDRLSVEGCLIYGLTGGAAIHVSTAARVKVTDTILRNNANGVQAENLAAVDIARSKILGNSAHGVLVNATGSGATTITLSDSIISDNGTGGRAFSATAGAQARLYANRVTAAGNTSYGVASEATGSGAALLSIGNSLIDKNAVGILRNGTNATVRTTGDNYVTDNTVDTSGVLTAHGLR